MNRYYYHRPYCENCKSIYNALAIGLILNCSKCGYPLAFRSFNPWPKTIGGLLIIFISGITMLIEVFPIIWIGGFIWGISLIYYGQQQWSKVKELDRDVEQEIGKSVMIDKYKKKVTKESEIHYCLSCGAKIKKDTNFCSQCGKKIKI